MYRRSLHYFLILIFILSLPSSFNNIALSTTNSGDEFLIVDCLLPGQLRKLGRKAVYQTARRPIKTSARECEIRGGEYVAFDRSSYASALKVWLPQAQAGDPEAQTYVGEIYEKGLGLPADYITAAQWYQKAADIGYSTAQINLGHMYEKGLGVPQDPEKALYWYRQASGLSDEMAFVPTQELEGLKQEAEESKREAESLRLQLNQSQQELDRTRQELKRRKGNIENQKLKLEDTRRELDSLRQQAVTTTNDEELNSLRTQLQQRENQLERQRQLISSLENESGDYKKQLDSMNQNMSDTAQYKQVAEESEQEKELLRKELKAAQDQLQKTKNEAESQQNKIEELRSEFNNRIEKVQTTSANQDEINNLRAQLKQRESELEKQNSEMIGLKNEFNELQVEAERQTQEIASLQKNDDPALSSDIRIEMIDPKIKSKEIRVATRGIKAKIKTRSGASRTIVGKVIAKFGIQSFTANGIDQKLNESGIFKFAQNVGASEMPIKLVAVDNKGNSAEVDFILAPEINDQSNIADESPGLNFGNYHALIIGNNDYINPKWDDLKTPQYDAKVVASILKNKYGFQTKVLNNANRSQILKAFSDYQKNLKSQDNLLIYYAGHGQVDEANNRGFWVPVDGEYERDINWISNLIIADYLTSIQARHIMVVADSCYSGTLTRGSVGSSKMSKDALRTLLKKKSRTALTSGDIQPVLDAGGGQNSVFAKAFIDVLNENNELLTGRSLHNKVYDAVTLKVEQIPQYSAIRYANHEGGEFFFKPK